MTIFVLVHYSLALSNIGCAMLMSKTKFWQSAPRGQPDPNQDECRKGGSQLGKRNYSASGIVRVIRLTDDGEFVDRCELTDAIYEVRNRKCLRSLFGISTDGSTTQI